jgi:hypothetical protein
MSEQHCRITGYLDLTDAEIHLDELVSRLSANSYAEAAGHRPS